MTSMYALGLIVFIGVLYGAQAGDDPLCEGCVFVNGAAFNNHTDCTKFVQCLRDENGDLQGHVRRCPFATYWDMMSLTCTDAENTDCQVDFCADKLESSVYGAATNCRGYWSCENSRSVPKCCGQDYYYDETLGCVEDVDNMCNDTCFAVQEPLIRQGVCERYTVPGEPNKFQLEVAGWGWVEQNCPPGTLFHESSCECLTFTPVDQANDECLPEVHLTFENDTTDQSGFPTSVINQNVRVKGGKATFNGRNSRLILPRFTNVGGIPTFVIRVNYTSRPKPIPSMAQALVVNSDCDNLPSLMISEDQTNTYFGVGTDENTFVYTYTARPSLSPNEHQFVQYKFNNGYLSGNNGYQESTEEATGFLRNVKCALHIGYADNLEPFNGDIYDLKIYLCDPDQP